MMLSLPKIWVTLALSLLRMIPPSHLATSSINDIFADAWVVPSPRSSRGEISTSMHYLKPDGSNSKSDTESNQISSISSSLEDQSHKFTPKERLDLKILLIDNHDSYTYNLYQYLSTMTIHPVKVVMNDEFSSWDAFMTSVSSENSYGTMDISTVDYFDCIIISPGPGQPSHAADMGIVLEAIRRNSNVPILGVCLGHQALGYVYGCEVKLAPCGPVHGLMSSVFYDESGDERFCQLFDEVPQNFDVMRYHSLVVQFPESIEQLEIEPIAWCNSNVVSIPDAEKNLAEDGKIASSSNSTFEICMGLRHKRYPHYGVQFHPESIGTAQNGYHLIWNFCEFAFQYNKQRSLELGTQQTIRSVDTMQQDLEDTCPVVAEIPSDYCDEKSPSTSLPGESSLSSECRYEVIIHKIEKDGSSPLPMPDQVFEHVYSSRHNSFWLDSSTGKTRMSTKGVKTKQLDVQVDREGCPITSNSRFSIMGSDDGPLSRKIEYFGREHKPEQRGLFVTSVTTDASASNTQERTEVLNTNILSYLRKQLVDEQELVRQVKIATFTEDTGRDVNVVLKSLNEFEQSGDEIPFDYHGGYVGYLGYEVRYDCSDGLSNNLTEVYRPDKTNPRVPSAAFLFADRSLLYDHFLDDWYIIGVSREERSNGARAVNAANRENTITWICGMTTTLRSLGGNGRQQEVVPSAKHLTGSSQNIHFTPNRSKEQYEMDISRSHDEIRKGKSYELCVTNQLNTELELPMLSTKDVHESPFELYKLLRRQNPAPFSSFFSLFPKEASTKGRQKACTAQMSICCSSPERFLSMKKATKARDFIVESKPIKGTAARYSVPSSITEDQQAFVEKIDAEIAARLKESVKDRAENLMIVDLLRNDLGRVCKVGSVHVPKLMHIESYATVHQMVSTVRGTVDGYTTNAIDVIEACFPGGSMTGAPKHRTMEILDEIEQGVSRGPYSGCLGYISLNGCMDMNIVIRTAILTHSEGRHSAEQWKASIGCGGAITALSNSNDEYEEMLLKSRAVRAAISEWAQSRESSQEFTSKGDD